MFTSQMEEEVIAILGLILTIANMTLKHVGMLGHLILPQMLEMCGDQVSKKVIFAFPPFATETAFHERLITSRKSARDEAKTIEFWSLVGWSNSCMTSC